MVFFEDVTEKERQEEKFKARVIKGQEAEILNIQEEF